MDFSFSVLVFFVVKSVRWRFFFFGTWKREGGGGFCSVVQKEGICSSFVNFFDFFDF